MPSNAGEGLPRRARLAVAALFLANGAVFANVVPRYPEIKAGLGLSNTLFGTAVGAYGLGALLVGFGGGALVRRYGSARVAPASTVAMAVNLVLLGLAPSWATLAAALFVAGALDSTADVANNAHGLRVERRFGRSILNSLHGLWSVGAVIGGLMGTAAAGLGVPVPWHLTTAGLLFAAVAVLARRHLLPGPDGSPAPPTARRGRVSRVHLAALALIAGAAQAMEDVGATWSTVYLREDLAATAAIGGFGFIALQAMQTLGRLVGDRAVHRYGDRAVARIGLLLAGGAIAAALAVPEPATTVAAFGAVGLGIGTLIPAALRTADSLPGLRPGGGLTVVGSGMRIASLTCAPVVGAVADAGGLRLALLAIPVAALAALLCSGALHRSP